MADINLANINWVDYIVIGILVVSLLVGLMRGFFREFVSLIIWGFVLGMAVLYATQLPVLFGTGPAISTGENTAITISFLAILVLTFIFGNLFENLITNIGTRRVGFVSRIFGALFGILRGLIIVMLFVLVMNLTPFGNKPEWKDAQTIHASKPIVYSIDDAIAPGFGNTKSESNTPAEEVKPPKKTNNEKDNTNT